MQKNVALDADIIRRHSFRTILFVYIIPNSVQTPGNVFLAAVITNKTTLIIQTLIDPILPLIAVQIHQSKKTNSAARTHGKFW